jgi:hypothetical protein
LYSDDIEESEFEPRAVLCLSQHLQRLSEDSIFGKSTNSDLIKSGGCTKDLRLKLIAFVYRVVQ